MRIAVTGSSGLVGSALVRSLTADGHQVVRLVRRAPADPDEVRWDPRAGTVDTASLGAVDAAVHLAGAGLGDKRWTAGYKRELRDSRVLGTAAVARALAAMDPAPRVLLSGSAIGWYGDTGDVAVDETSPPGKGFLAETCIEWEAATAPALEAGIRVAHLRTGLVVSEAGGAWGRMFPLFKAGVGGRLGSGRQYWSFVSLADEIAAIRHVLDHDTIAGPVNLTAPNPVTNAEATKAMGKALRRPTVFAVPPFALRAVLGEFANDILVGQRVLPNVLTDSGFTFAHPTVREAIAAAIAD
ncbi:TIGR01777 family oxidoreductase [Streptomyces sp. SID3343]|uniref:TIGR01777 family oxidoreductase n=1 Tax=Streptomyces sp. SID3343 TaxID=2690260 RepID=UPI0013707961|nr:TIGR01777 family oxidoreductase [Streptomyces sp. SID3343]MYW06633.1 TIGR01777 family protein [Streptomyces sp. SID3343]